MRSSHAGSLRTARSAAGSAGRSSPPSPSPPGLARNREPSSPNASAAAARAAARSGASHRSASRGSGHHRPALGPGHVRERAAGDDGGDPLGGQRGQRQGVGPAGGHPDHGERVEPQGVGDGQPVGHPPGDAAPGPERGQPVPGPVDADERDAGGRGLRPGDDRLQPAPGPTVAPHHRRPPGGPVRGIPDNPPVGHGQRGRFAHPPIVPDGLAGDRSHIDPTSLGRPAPDERAWASGVVG